jgi:hypothetical protein
MVPSRASGTVKLTDYATIFGNFLCDLSPIGVTNDGQIRPAAKEYCVKSFAVSVNLTVPVQELTRRGRHPHPHLTEQRTHPRFDIPQRGGPEFQRRPDRRNAHGPHSEIGPRWAWHAQIATVVLGDTTVTHGLSKGQEKKRGSESPGSVDK